MMKKLPILLLLITAFSYSQSISFTFQNARNTNDGSNDYYEADIYISTDTDFKLGSGQIYFTYSTAAFGENIHTNGNFEFSQPSGSILAETYSGFPAYKDFIVNDNTTSRVSTSFQQGLSSGTISANNVTSTAKHLCSIKIKYVDVNEDPTVAFETGSVFLDQFYTACGPTSFGFPDCTNEPGTRIYDDTFDSSGAALGGTLSIDNIEFNQLVIYPNPSKEDFKISGIQEKTNIEIFDVSGKRVFKKTIKNNEVVNAQKFSSGIYFIKLNKEKSSITKKIIIK